MAKRLPQIGWREWIGLPDLGIERIAAKVDTGAKTSALHARDVVVLPGGWVEFTAPLLVHQRHVEQWERGGVRRVRAPLVEERIVRSSNGEDEQRTIVKTTIVVQGIAFVCEFSLTTRTRLRFPVLLGRSAVKGRFLVNAALPRSGASAVGSEKAERQKR
jgi:hypothetical protein